MAAREQNPWFEDTPVIGRLPPSEAVKKLRELGETDLANAVESRLVSRGDYNEAFSFPGLGGAKPWDHTSHTFGYIPRNSKTEQVDIVHAGAIQPEWMLRGKRIKITLDGLRVAAYPGGGIHTILFDFYGQNQADGGTEHLHYNQMLRAHEGESVGVSGVPVFVGLNVGDEGVQFKCYTVNVKNEDDERFLRFLESDSFKGGLELLKTVQPAIAPMAAMAVAVTKHIAGRNRNVGVQDFSLGLDFSQVETRAKLAQGSYVAVQIPQTFEAQWDWSLWIYDKRNGQIVKRDDTTTLIPYNYIVFGLSEYQ